MANEKIIFDTEVKVGNSVGSVKSLKAELRAVTNELGTLENGSEAFIKAAKKAGALKDQIGDIKDVVAAFNPEAKFQALAGAVGIAANGFSAMQGAMALMGSENEDLNKTIAKTQGAIALATGLNGLLGMKDAFNVLSLVIKTNVVAAFATMRAAIISTGIAGLVILIGTLIYQFVEEKNATEAASKALDEHNKKLREQGQAIQDLSVELLKGRDREAAELANKQTKELVALQDLYAKKELTEAEFLERQSLTIQKFEIQNADLKKKFEDEDKAKQDEKNKKAIATKQQHLKELADIDKFENDAINEGNKTIQEEKEKEEEAKIKRERALAAQTILVKQEQYAQEQADAKADADAKVKIAELEIQAKKQLLQEIVSILGSLSQLVGQQTAEGKALAIAQATINTYLGASEAFTGSLKIDPTGVLGSILAGVAVLQGIANVNAIANVQVPNGGGGGGGGIAAPPAPRIAPSLSGAKLGGNSEVITNNKGGVQKVIVTETDITNTQNKVKNIVTKATIR
jgi:hypothetical protein